MRDVHQRNGNGRGRKGEMRSDLLVANCLQHVAHSLSQLTERDHVFVISQVQVKSNAFGHVIGEPPIRVARFVSGPRDRGAQPIAVELKELSRGCPEIWKFFLKRDHDFYLRARASERWCWSSSALSQAETIPAGAHSALCDAQACGSHPQIDRHPGSAGKPTRNANRRPRQSHAVFRAPSRQLLTTELRVRWFPTRVQFRPPFLLA